MDAITKLLHGVMQVPLPELIAQMSPQYRLAELERARRHVQHAAFLGPEWLALFELHESADIEAVALMQRMCSGSS